jgi:hypothetical protein
MYEYLDPMFNEDDASDPDSADEGEPRALDDNGEIPF